ncbi:hypothetical protein EON63_13145 [archaeon]|nr:MAG: hypothetical protein EON63_13145 [archaeon]
MLSLFRLEMFRRCSARLKRVSLIWLVVREIQVFLLVRVSLLRAPPPSLLPAEGVYRALSVTVASYTIHHIPYTISHIH